MNAKQLTAAETIVMKCIWDADHEMSLAEIVKNANEGYGKEWKPQTVSTYLAKLCLKNYIQMKRAGRTITYEILITEEDYKSEQAREFVAFWTVCHLKKSGIVVRGKRGIPVSRECSAPDAGSF